MVKIDQKRIKENSISCNCSMSVNIEDFFKKGQVQSWSRFLGAGDGEWAGKYEDCLYEDCSDRYNAGVCSLAGFV